MNAVFKIALDIHKVGSQITIPAFRGDSGYTIIITLMESGKSYTISDKCTAIFEGKKPDGTFLCNDCTIENGKIVYDFKKAMNDNGEETCQTTAVAGDVQCQLKLIGEDGRVVSSPKFTILVENTVYNEEEIIQSASEYTALTDYIADLNAKINGDYFDDKIRSAADTENIWRAFAQTGRFYEAANGIANISVATMIERLVEHIDIGAKDELGVQSDLAHNVKIFVRDMQTDDLFFVNSVDVLAAISKKNNGEAYPYGLTPIFSTSSIIEAGLAQMPARKGKGSASVEFGTDTCKAIGNNSLAGGAGCMAEQKEDVALGLNNTASGKHSMAINSTNKARQADTFVHGCGNTATGYAQRVGGRFCKSNANMAEIIGNGTDENNRSNAYTLDWDGNAWYAGTVYSKGKELMTKEEAEMQSENAWSGIGMTGCILRVENPFATATDCMKTSINILNMVTHNGVINGTLNESFDSELAKKVRIFVLDLSTNDLYFVSASEANKAAIGSFEPTPVFTASSSQGCDIDEVLDSIFPDVNSREDITSQADWYQLPSDDAKILLYSNSGYIYICDENYNEPMLNFKDGATSPYLLPDDIENQEAAVNIWKAGNYFEGVGTEAAYLITTKEQTDKTAVSPTRLAEIIEAATETKTIYIPVAKYNEHFILTEEMKRNGLVIRKNALRDDPASGSFTIYNPDGVISGEPYISDIIESGGIAPFDVSRYEVGSMFQFQGAGDHPYVQGSLEVQMPIMVKSVSKDKLLALLGSE